MTGVVLVTGVSRDVAARCARALSATHEVVGIDVTAPRRDLGRGTFIRADLRSPALTETVRRLNPTTVIHHASTAGPDLPANLPATAKELAVMGTLNLISAVEQAGIEQFVMLSSVSVYSASASQVTYLTESVPMDSRPTDGARRHLIEVETAVAGLARRHPEMAVTVLRLGALMGSGVDTVWSRFLSQRAVIRLAGFDARVQFLHPADAVAAVEAVVATGESGVFNAAAPDVLPLSLVLRLVGRPPLPVPKPLAPVVARTLKQPIPGRDFDELAYGRVVDSSRLTEATGWTARTSSRRAVEEFAAFVRPGLWSADRLDGVLAGLAKFTGDER
ncbi:NAD-dependent epimerase/dehydratase family protein [Enemella sp. A6]|uniref:NAD-dependent epimerase/dehydratase family protein n=1 Tax=Enemella sp. A6 TaxID=3440152 RepID=UPI003EBFE5A7